MSLSIAVAATSLARLSRFVRNSKLKISSSSLPCCCRFLKTSKLLGQRHRLWLHHSLHFSSLAQLSHDSPVSRVVARPNVVEVLEERGLLESLTSDTLRSMCSDPNLPPLRVYCGFDPTAESLHLGNLLGIIVLSWFLRCGHKVIALVGGATARVGDPSGKSLERPELDLLTLEKNTNGISAIICSILGRVGTDSSFVVLNNYDWWKDVTLLDFLKEVGRYARVGNMMSKESVRKRLESEQGMSYTEFTYQLLQGFDFVHLFRKEGVSVQIGGSDQWGNVTAGTDLIRKILQADGAYGLTFPLLVKGDGTKFGKSEDGAIWLSPSLLSPYKFYQYFFSVPDVDVVRFLKILTFLSMEEIAQLERDMQMPSYVPNTAQCRLAEEVTRFVHGNEGLNEALRATEALRPGSETKLDWKTIDGIAQDVPSCYLSYDHVLNLSLLDLCVSTGLIESKSAARRLLKQGGLYLNNSRVDSEAKKIEADDIIEDKIILLSAGKKNKMVMKKLAGNSTCDKKNCCDRLLGLHWNRDKHGRKSTTWITFLAKLKALPVAEIKSYLVVMKALIPSWIEISNSIINSRLTVPVTFSFNSTRLSPELEKGLPKQGSIRRYHTVVILTYFIKSKWRVFASEKALDFFVFQNPDYQITSAFEFEV